MQNFNIKLKNSINNFFSEIYSNFKKYDYAIICNNEERKIILFERSIDSYDIAQFTIENYSYTAYLFETDKRDYILIFNTSNDKNFRLNILNISNLYQNAEIGLKQHKKELGDDLLFYKFSSQKFTSFIKLLKLDPASRNGIGFWRRESLIDTIQTKLNSHGLHYWWCDVTSFQSLSVSRFKYKQEIMWGLLYHDHYNYDLSNGIPVLIFDNSPKFIKEKAEEYVELLHKNNISYVNVGFEILGDKWSGYNLYKTQSSFYRNSYLKKIKRDTFSVYYKK